MKSVLTIFFLLLAVTKSSFSQSLDSLLSSIQGNSKDLITTQGAKAILQPGKASLRVLSQRFQDMSATKVYSDCQNRYLTKGEVAMIMADRIEPMPYFILTGIQNCTLTFCKDNANLIEYYFDVIQRDGIATFQQKYQEWLVSKDRKKTYGTARSNNKVKS